MRQKGSVDALGGLPGLRREDGQRVLVVVVLQVLANQLVQDQVLVRQRWLRVVLGARARRKGQRTRSHTTREPTAPHTNPDTHRLLEGTEDFGAHARLNLAE